MKHWISVLIGLVCSNSAFASVCPFSGIYGGVNIGLIQNDLSNDYSTVIIIPGAENLLLTDGPAHETDTSLVGGLTLGYATLLNNMFLVGIEGRANFQNLDITEVDQHNEFDSSFIAAATTTVKLKQDYALLAKLGIVANCNVLMYGLIGIDWGKIDVSSNAIYSQNLESSLSGATQVGSRSKYESGLALGLGMEYLFTPCASIGLEYAYVDYSNLDFPSALTGSISTDGTPVVGASIQDNNAIEMNTNKVLVKVNYYFG